MSVLRRRAPSLPPPVPLSTKCRKLVRCGWVEGYQTGNSILPHNTGELEIYLYGQRFTYYSSQRRTAMPMTQGTRGPAKACLLTSSPSVAANTVSTRRNVHSTSPAKASPTCDRDPRIGRIYRKQVIFPQRGQFTALPFEVSTLCCEEIQLLLSVEGRRTKPSVRVGCRPLFSFYYGDATAGSDLHRRRAPS